MSDSVPHHHHGHHHHNHHDHVKSQSLFGGHDHDYSRAGRRSLMAALVLLLVHMVVDIVGGVLSGSLSLLAHAGHMVTDMGALIVALAALRYSQLPASAERTFGLRRLEVLAALFNVILLWTVAGSILLRVFQVVEQGHSHAHAHLGTYLLAIGALGIVIHLTSAFILHRSMHHSVSVEGGLFAMFRSTRWNRWPSSSPASWCPCSTGTSWTGS